MALRLSTGLRNKLCGINNNKITNGSFSTDTSNWTAVNANLTSTTGGQSGNCLSIATNSANVAQAYQDVTCKKGRVYKLSVYYKDGTVASKCRIKIGTTSVEDYYYDSGDLGATSWTEKVIFFQTDDGTGTETVRITLQNSDTSNNGYDVLFDEVSLISLSRSLQDIFYRGVIKIYSGTQPSSADNAPTGTLLVTIYSNEASGIGLSFADASGGTLSKTPGETWAGTVANTGTAGWFRLEAPGDSGASSTTDERIDGAIATSGAELNMSSTSLVSGSIQAISAFQLTLPAE